MRRKMSATGRSETMRKLAEERQDFKRLYCGKLRVFKEKSRFRGLGN